MTDSHTVEQARADWERRMGDQGSASASGTSIAVPGGLRATSGRGQVTLDWEPVEGALGYLVQVASSPDGPFGSFDETGRDILAIPHPPYVVAAPAGASGDPEQRWYTVSAVADVAATGERSVLIAGEPTEPVAAAPLPASDGTGSGDGPASVTARVTADRVVRPLPRPWRPIVGSEHLSHMLCQDRSGGRPIGDELAEALRMCREDFGVETVRAHAILCDDLGVYREVDGEPVHDFSAVDRVYDRLLELGLRPVVELSFMPRDLASDPDKTVFAYQAIISPPRDWQRWHDLVRDLTRHLVDRYGLEEVRDRWSFEIWNEANLEVFWSGTREEYLRLYEESARAIRSVDPGLRVGGPGSAADAWVGELLAHADTTGSPVDFISTHTYGSPPLDLRPLLARHGREGVPIWWTEWGVSPQHFDVVSDGPFSAAFLARGMRSAAGRIESLAYWVASDHFEELGRPDRLLHGGFGLMTVGNLRKPRFWALSMLDRLGADEVAVEMSGDGAGGLVEAWPSRDPDGRVAVAMWNGVLDQSAADGRPALERRVRLRVEGLTDGGAYEVVHHRLDRTHSNVAAVWEEMGGGDWPDEDGWAALRAADTLDPLEPARVVTAAGGAVDVEFDLPMPAMSLIELLPRT